MNRSTRQPGRWQSPSAVLSDVRAGFLEISRHSLALFGLSVLVLVLALATPTPLRTSAGEWLMGWLNSRQDEGQLQAELDLNPEQARVTQWLSRKYKVAPVPLANLVVEAWQLGHNSQLPPTLILSVMAVESGFNPFALGSQGARGLMQVAPGEQADTLAAFGGPLALFDPLTNLRLGARLLQAMVLQGGDLESGLRLYAQASGQANAQGYAERVLSEAQQLERIGQTRATSAALPARMPRL